MVICKSILQTDSMYQLLTLVVFLILSAKPIGCKRIYNAKLKSDGSKNAIRSLVALGNQREYRIDQDETFAPVAKIP